MYMCISGNVDRAMVLPSHQESAYTTGGVTRSHPDCVHFAVKPSQPEAGIPARLHPPETLSHTAGPLTSNPLTNASSASILCESQAAAAFGSYASSHDSRNWKIDAVEHTRSGLSRSAHLGTLLCFCLVFEPRCIRSETPGYEQVRAIVNG